MRIAFAILCMSFALTSQATTPHRQPIELDTPGTLHPHSDHFDDALTDLISAGERNLNWLKNINAHRDSKSKISLSSKETQAGYPIDAPNIYNTQIILQNYNTLKAQLPLAIANVVINGAPQTDTPPMADADYVHWCLEVDRLYQLAVRWSGMEDDVDYYRGVRNDDIRGYYFLSRDTGAEKDLSTWLDLTPARKAQLSDWLTQICANKEADYDSCKSKVAGIINASDAASLYQQYFANAKAHYDSYFQLQGERDDIKWSAGQPDVMNTFFTDPGVADIAAFLKTNIEDEWRIGSWHLELNIVPDAESHIEFEAGTTPHVNGIAGNIITMDGNAPLTEYAVNWTIRHEYGHVLGFPDCYIELYDDDQQAIVSYQLDTTNLMCSRQGHFQQIHFDELKKHYLK